MSIIGIGTDIVEVSRFEPSRFSTRFMHAVFSPSERIYCLSKRRSAQHFAVRFAAKEAAVKALAEAFPFVSVCQIEVLRADSGKPELGFLAGRHGEPPPQLAADTQIHVTLSHSDHYAVATVIVEQAS